METRPFKILGVQQIALGHTDLEALKKLWVDRLGLSVRSTFRSEKENVNELILSVGIDEKAQVEIDLMQPLDVTRSPRVHEPALNHIGLWVDNLSAAYAWLEAQGVRMAPGGIRKGAGDHDVCFIHPKGNDAYPESGAGVLIELVQAPASML